MDEGKDTLCHSGSELAAHPRMTGKSRIKTAMDGVFRLAPVPRQAHAHPTPNGTKGRDETQNPRAPYGSKVLENMFPIHLSPADLLGGDTATPYRSCPRKWESREVDQLGDPRLRGDERTYWDEDEAHFCHSGAAQLNPEGRDSLLPSGLYSGRTSGSELAAHPGMIGKSRIKTAMDGVFRLAPVPRGPSFLVTPSTMAPQSDRRADEARDAVSEDRERNEDTQAQKPRAPYGSKVLENMFPIHLSPADLLGGDTETPTRSFPRKWESREAGQNLDPHLRGDERTDVARSEHSTGSSASSFETPSAMAPQDEAISNSHPHPDETQSVVTKDGDERTSWDGDERNGKSRIKTAMDGVFRLAPMPRQALAHPTPNDTKGRDETQNPRAPYGSKVLENMFPIHLSPADLMGDSTETPTRAFPRKWESREVDQLGDPHLRGDERSYLLGDEEHFCHSGAAQLNPEGRDNLVPSGLCSARTSGSELAAHPGMTGNSGIKTVMTHITDIFDAFDTRIEAYQIAQIYLNKARSYLRADRAYECPV